MELAFLNVGKKIYWEGSGLDEVGREGGPQGKIRVKINPAFYRKIELTTMTGSPAKVGLGQPTSC